VNLIQDTIKSHARGLRSTPKGWWTTNCPMCLTFGQPRPDTRRRGGFIFHPDGATAYHCFNCGFKTKWRPGQTMGHKLKSLMKQIGVDEAEIQRINMRLLAEKDDTVDQAPVDDKPIWRPAWPPCDVPGTNQLPDDAFEYLDNRRMLDLADWHYSNDNKFWNLDRRVILPYVWQGATVGYSARWIGDPPKGSPKTLRKAPPDFVFNLDPQGAPRRFVLVVEGEYDALAIDGVAVLHNDINARQVQLITDLDVEPIVVPDQDNSGGRLAERAIELGWSVAFPEWDPGIKDAADAARSYGRVAALNSILQSREDNQLKIKIRLRKSNG